MGLREEIQAELTEAFDGDLSDVVVPFVLRKIVRDQDSYNVATDSFTDVTTNTNSRGVFVSYGVEEIDGVNILSEDERLIINGPDISVAVEIDDKVILASGAEMLVKNVRKIVGGETTPIVWILQVRKNV